MERREKAEDQGQKEKKVLPDQWVHLVQLVPQGLEGSEEGMDLPDHLDCEE
jgi:hypothetical protein